MRGLTLRSHLGSAFLIALFVGNFLILGRQFEEGGQTWTSKSAHVVQDDLLAHGPRQTLYRLSGRSMFEGGVAILGDRQDPQDLVEKGPPFRPALDLNGIPLYGRETIRRFKTVAARLRNERGFTLIELVMVVLLLSILAAVAIPNFQDMRTDARNSSVKGALGGVRSAIAIARATIALKEDVGRPPYPTALEMQQNIYDASHPIISAITTTAQKRIMDASGGIPINPWSLTTVPLIQQSSIVDCAGATKSFVRSTAAQTDIGWCYNSTTGEFWANSDRNSGVTGATENAF